MSQKHKKRNSRSKRPKRAANSRIAHLVFERPKHEANPQTLRSGMTMVVSRRIVARGEVDLPCIPGLLDFYASRLCAMWETLGKAFSASDVAQLRQSLEQYLAIGFQASPFARLVIAYEAEPLEGVTYGIRAEQPTMQEHYTHWVSSREAPLFGKVPDAKVMALVTEIAEKGDDPRRTKVLDVGAGIGRNAIPMARLGHETVAIEAVPALANEMRNAAIAARVSLEIIEGDILSPELALGSRTFGLVVISEVITHFRSPEEVRLLFQKLAVAVVSGGLVLVSAMLACEDYQPEPAVRETSQTAWSFILTRAEIRFITEELPFEQVSDESVHDYEKEHLAPEHWPPTSWFESWTQGGNVFGLTAGSAPIEMRWLLYRRR